MTSGFGSPLGILSTIIVIISILSDLMLIVVDMVVVILIRTVNINIVIIVVIIDPSPCLIVVIIDLNASSSSLSLPITTIAMSIPNIIINDIVFDEHHHHHRLNFCRTYVVVGHLAAFVATFPAGTPVWYREDPAEWSLVKKEKRACPSSLSSSCRLHRAAGPCFEPCSRL